MGQRIDPATLLTMFEDHERRLAIMERTARLPNLSTADLGLQAEAVETNEEVTTTTFDDLATAGPSVTVEVTNTGRLLVMGFSQVNIAVTAVAGGGNTGQATLGMSVDGGAVDANRVGEHLVSAFIEDPWSLGSSTPMSYWRLYTGLSKGSHTAAMKYKKANAGEQVFCKNRLLIAWPL